MKWLLLLLIATGCSLRLGPETPQSIQPPPLPDVLEVGVEYPFEYPSMCSGIIVFGGSSWEPLQTPLQAGLVEGGDLGTLVLADATHATFNGSEGGVLMLIKTEQIQTPSICL